MNLLNAEGVSKSYSEKILINNINLGINEGDKIGVIGINGTGKTTLLKIIAGLIEPDEGRVVKGSSVRVEYLPQNPEFDRNATVLEQVFKGESQVMQLIREYEKALIDPKTSPDELVRLTHAMDAADAWSIESEAKSVLTRLGISDFDAIVGTLSGGQRKRIALAGALISPSHLLILDEPTNHLDNDTIDWLEQYLNKKKGALLMVTHDRYFLDRVVNEILELDGGNIYLYSGNYSYFLEKKVEREELEAAVERKRHSLFKKELAWIRRGAKARTTKQKARIDRFEKLEEQSVSSTGERLDISSASTRLGKKVVELENIDKSYGNKELIRNFGYMIQRDDRVGIVGPNGMGKSTLMNIIFGIVKPDRGMIEVGETVKMGLYSQETFDMDEGMRAIEYIKEGAEFVTTADGYRISASQMMERFLFSPSLQWSPIGKLSGGERRRLYLLRVLMESPNVLLLDEPTNDLDIETLTILEDYLEDFEGAVIAVSHDRYFLDRIAEKIFAFEGNGKITQYTGNYSDYREKSAQNREEAALAAEKSNLKAVDINKPEIQKKKPLKFTFKEQREFEEIDDLIAEIEDKIACVGDRINHAASDYTLLQELLKEKEGLEKQLEEKMDRWVYLNELAEKIEMEK